MATNPNTGHVKQPRLSRAEACNPPAVRRDPMQSFGELRRLLDDVMPGPSSVPARVPSHNRLDQAP